MTTATSVPTAERIVAIDFDKCKSVVCDYPPSSGEVASPSSMEAAPNCTDC